MTLSFTTPRRFDRRTGEAWVGHGQCIQLFGAGEAYLPVLAALGQICRESRGQRLIELLARHAPTWLLQMPALLAPAELEALQQKAPSGTREGMLREMAEAVEALSAELPLVLALEDLHWSDAATVDLLSFLAQRRQPARLLVIGTYRPVEAIVREHPLREVKRELQLHGHCQELPLRLLSGEEVERYLVMRFSLAGQHTAPLRKLARALHQRAEGNPLFMVNVVRDLLAQSVIVEGKNGWEIAAAVGAVTMNVPDNLRQMVEKQLERLSPEERQSLEAGSVAGAEFSAAAVAAALGEDTGKTEARCEGLARCEQFLRGQGAAAWPDGTTASRYGFVHALYREVIHQQVAEGRRRELHQRIGERAEAAYGERAGEIAAELAVHFEQARDQGRAVKYLQQAAETAVRRHAHPEAIGHLTRALKLLEALPATPERDRKELTIQTRLGSSCIASKGYAAPEAEKPYTRALELCRHLGGSAELFATIWGLQTFYQVRGDLNESLALADQLVEIAERANDPALLFQAHYVNGDALFFCGEFTRSRSHLERASVLHHSERDHSVASEYGGHESGISMLGFMANDSWFLGYVDRGLREIHAAHAAATELGDAPSPIFAFIHSSFHHLFRREAKSARQQSERLIGLCTEYESPYFHALGIVIRGWALAEEGQPGDGVAEIEKGLIALRSTGAELDRPMILALLAEALSKVERVDDGLRALEEAFEVSRRFGTPTFLWEPELYRIKGEALLSPSTRKAAEAEGCFRHAIAVARQQSAKSLELRATTSLARLLRKRRRGDEARQALVEVYGWFTEGFDTLDLKQAKALLEELSR